MTEREAKTKWCPFARAVEYTAGGGSFPRNRVGDSRDMSVLASNLLGAQCLGSACMAWRWREPPGPRPPDAPEPSDEGWCGLAGKP